MKKFSGYQGLSVIDRISESLSPDYFKMDERKTEDFLLYINSLAQKLKYFNSSNEAFGDWVDFFLSDESFLLAEIVNYQLKDIEQKKLELIQSFDAFSSIEQKTQIWKEVFNLILEMFLQIDKWYKRAATFNKNRESSSLENELISAIDYSLSSQLNLLASYDLGKPFAEYSFEISFDYGAFSPIWKIENVLPENIFYRGENKPEQLSNALKQLLIVYRNTFRTVTQIVTNAPRLFQNSLENNDEHQPHIGLVLSFLQVFQLIQKDLNQMTERHLDYYFSEILQQYPIPGIEDNAYFYLDIMDALEAETIPEGRKIVAGQNEEGQLIFYKLLKTLYLSSVKIVGLKNLYVSRNPIIDIFSQYRMVRGIYSSELNSNDEGKVIAAKGWTSFGKEQLFLTQNQRTMEAVEVGFAISSSTLKLSSGQRIIRVTFCFAPSSILQMIDMLVDIANQRKIKPEDVFYEVFSNAFQFKLTGDSGWIEVERYQIFAPDDFTLGQFTFEIELLQDIPPIVKYVEDIHQRGLQSTHHPVLTAFLKGDSTFYAYSFFEELKLEEIRLEVEVKEFYDFKLFNSFGPIELSGPAEILGPIPKPGDYFMLGSDELFSKELSDLKLFWQYTSFPFENGGLKEYYEAYQKGITNKSFQLKVSARSNYQFNPFKDDKKQSISLFEENNKKEVLRERKLSNLDLKKLELKPAYFLTREDVENFSLSSGAGFLKFELAAPTIGFGFDLFPKIFAEVVTKNAAKPNAPLPVPNQPFAPKINALKLEYKAVGKMVFDPRRVYENDDKSGDSFFHFHPFGIKKAFDKGRAITEDFIPQFEKEGYLFIGLKEIKPGQMFSLLFILEKNENWEPGKTEKPEWHYLSDDHWKPLRNQALLEDTTSGLINSGIITFLLPTDIGNQNNILDSETYWFSLSVRKKAETYSQIKAIYPNGGIAKYDELSGGRKSVIHLPAGSLTEFEDPFPGVVSLHQPIDTFGGESSEDKMNFYTRISERLRHKERAINRWDFERLLLSKFDWISQIKCMGHFGNENYVRQGYVKIVALPKIEPTANFYEPSLNIGQINALKNYISPVSSPFVKIDVQNPSYEYLRIKCKIRFDTNASGLHIKGLYEELMNYVCPWFYSDKVRATMGGEVKISDLFNFIKTRPYVMYLTGFSVVHLQIDKEGKYTMKDSAVLESGYDTIQGGTPWSVFVMSALNEFEIVESDDYYPPEPTALTEMRIGEDLIISGNIEEQRFKDESEKNEEENEDPMWFELSI
jgi:hypothetical protein